MKGDLLKRKQKEALVLQVGQCLVSVTAGKREGKGVFRMHQKPDL